MTPEIRSLRDQLAGRIEDHRNRLEGNLSELQTAAMRGSIAELRWVLEQIDPPAKPLPAPNANQPKLDTYDC